MYKKIDLEHKRKIQIGILDFFHEFCEQNDLTYYLTGGTLLGAVRHKGFIPWDDDIDINMPRADYERLLDLFNKLNKDSHYKTVSIRDEGYYLASAKILDVETRLKENVDTDFEIGVFIDVFPLDQLRSNYQAACRLFRKVEYYRNILTLKNIKIANGRAWHKNIALWVSKVLLSGIQRKTILERIDRYSREYENDLDSEFIGTPCTAVYGIKEIFRSKWLSERCLLDFEGKKYWAPKCYEDFLTQLYGDYMQLPPVEKRVSHHDNIAWIKD